MKRAILILFALTFVLAVPLAGCGLTHVAGSVLLGGGGLTLTLIMTLAFVSGRATARTPRATAPAQAAVTAAVAGPRPQAIVVEEATPEARAPELDEVAAFFVKAAVKESALPGDGFGADELAFFAEGETLALRPSDSSPTWRLS